MRARALSPSLSLLSLSQVSSLYTNLEHREALLSVVKFLHGLCHKDLDRGLVANFLTAPSTGPCGQGVQVLSLLAFLVQTVQILTPEELWDFMCVCVCVCVQQRGLSMHPIYVT